MVQWQSSQAFPVTVSKVDYLNISSPKPSQTQRNNNNIAHYVMIFLYGQRYPIGFYWVPIALYGHVPCNRICGTGHLN